jgi:hypothetical protein
MSTDCQIYLNVRHPQLQVKISGKRKAHLCALKSHLKNICINIRLCHAHYSTVRLRWADNIKMDHKETGWGGLASSCEHDTYYAGNVLTGLGTVIFSGMTLLDGIGYSINHSVSYYHFCSLLCF